MLIPALTATPSPLAAIMRTFPFILGILYLLCSNCKTKANENWTIEILSSKDNCYKLVDSSNKVIAASRVLKIIENTFKDTIVLGYSVLYPGYTGDLDI